MKQKKKKDWSIFSPFFLIPDSRRVDLQLSHVMRKPDFCLCENKGADQLCSNWEDCEADQRLCFRYTDTVQPHYNAIFGVHRSRPCYK